MKKPSLRRHKVGRSMVFLRARNVSAIASTLSALGTGPGAIDWLCPDYAVASAGVSKAVRSSFAVSASAVTGLNTKVVRMSERSPFLLKKISLKCHSQKFVSLFTGHQSKPAVSVRLNLQNVAV